jgi:putative FmdB family regulatory protein
LQSPRIALDSSTEEIIVPTYEYRCSAGHQYEKRESFSAPARQRCQVCGKTADRMIFAPPVVFKGSGFYVTDSRSSNGASATSDSGEAAAPKESTTTPEAGHSPPHGAGTHSHDSSSGTVESAAAS